VLSIALAQGGISRSASRRVYPRGSAAPDGELPPRITNTGMGAVGARRAVPGTGNKAPDME